MTLEETRQHPELRMTEGTIRVSSVTQLIEHDDCEIWEIDLNSKYPVHYVRTEWLTDGVHHEVMLFADAHTLRVDKNADGPTIFEIITPPGEQWAVLTDGGRYTVRVIAYRYPPVTDED